MIPSMASKYSLNVLLAVGRWVMTDLAGPVMHAMASVTERSSENPFAAHARSSVNRQLRQSRGSRESRIGTLTRALSRSLPGIVGGTIGGIGGACDCVVVPVEDSSNGW